MELGNYRVVVKLHIVFYIITLMVLVALGVLTWNFWYLFVVEAAVVGMLLVLFCREWVW